MELTSDFDEQRLPFPTFPLHFRPIPSLYSTLLQLTAISLLSTDLLPLPLTDDVDLLQRAVEKDARRDWEIEVWRGGDPEKR